MTDISKTIRLRPKICQILAERAKIPRIRLFILIVQTDFMLLYQHEVYCFLRPTLRKRNGMRKAR